MLLVQSLIHDSRSILTSLELGRSSGQCDFLNVEEAHVPEAVQVSFERPIQLYHRLLIRKRHIWRRISVLRYVMKLGGIDATYATVRNAQHQELPPKQATLQGKVTWTGCLNANST